MKFFKSLILCGAVVAGLSITSCRDWLNVNVDPENPTSESAAYNLRLPHIEFFTVGAYFIGARTTEMITGDWIRTNYLANWCIWGPNTSVETSPYQWWFVGAGCNIQDMYDKAMADGAYHYAGLGKLFRAFGFMYMTDLYGEMPYSDALGEAVLPKYDTGKEIYQGCLKELDEAIALLSKPQEENAIALAAGDYINNGDTGKWIKFAYLLKARWLNKLNKKAAGNIEVDAEGNYTKLAYDPAAILAALDKAQQSNADNTVVHAEDAPVTSIDFLWNEPTNWNELYSVCGMNGGFMATNALFQNLTNFAGLGVEDPRADKILPWARCDKKDGATYPAGMKWSADGKWRRSLGVDMTSSASPTLTGGPIRPSFSKSKGGWYIDSDNAARLGDTVYVCQTCWAVGTETHSNSTPYNGTMIYLRDGSSEKAALSGTFHTRPDAPMFLGTYMEACFIKAEVLMKQGKNAEAFAAYKAGVQASCELMNEKLGEWEANAVYATIPSFTKMTAADITNFVNNGIGTSGNITLGKIMTQKRIAMMWQPELWNDMRRYDFDTNIFLNWDMPVAHATNAGAMSMIPAGKQWRRFEQCSHERNYNATNLQEVGSRIAYYAEGIVLSDDSAWGTEKTIWTIPVWWDTDKD